MTTDQTTPIVRRPGKRANGSGRDPVRPVRVSDELWDDAKKICHARGISVSSVMVRALEELVAEAKRDD